MKITFQCLGLLLVLSLTVSCQNKVNGRLIIDDETCSIPCWNTITPGETSYLQAKEILLNTPGVNKETIEESTFAWQGYDQLFWTMDKDIAGRIYSMNGTIKWISIAPQPGESILNKHRVLNIKNSDVVLKYGLPQTVIILRLYNGFVLFGFNNDLGVSFSYTAHRNFFNPVDTFSEDGYISEITYFEPESLPALIETGWFNPTNGTSDLMEYTYNWNGFGNIDEKYPIKANK